MDTSVRDCHPFPTVRSLTGSSLGVNYFPSLTTYLCLVILPRLYTRYQKVFQGSSYFEVNECRHRVSNSVKHHKKKGRTKRRRCQNVTKDPSVGFLWRTCVWELCSSKNPPPVVLFTGRSSLYSEGVTMGFGRSNVHSLDELDSVIFQFVQQCDRPTSRIGSKLPATVVHGVHFEILLHRNTELPEVGRWWNHSPLHRSITVTILQITKLYESTFSLHCLRVFFRIPELSVQHLWNTK